MKTKFTILCFVFALCANMHTATAQVNVQDSLALVDLYDSTNGPNWNNHTNWLTKAPVTTWYGIQIVTNGRVNNIYLGINNLTGNIPSSIGNLTNLEVLDFYENQLSGIIPSSIGNLINIQSLLLYYNQLSGSIPSTIGNLVNLQDLALGSNQLSGSIPSSIGNLINLQRLDLHSNQLSGTIPSSIGNLVNLYEADLFNNQLSGSIPSSIGNLTNLNGLYLYTNHLSGRIPSSIGNLINLQYLRLEDNQLSGTIPSTVGNLVNLLWLASGANRLSGTVPSSLSNLIHINDNNGNRLDLSYNYFTFDGMELIAQTFPKKAYYDNQKNISIHQNGNTLSVHAGGTLSNNTYKWFKYDGTTYTLVTTLKADSTFHPSENGRYRVRVLNSIATKLKLYGKPFDYIAPANAIIASSENTLQQYNKANVFRVYPNPASDVLHVETDGTAMFSLIDQSGKILLTTVNINGKGSIDISGIASGLYYLKNNSAGTVQKVVVAR